MVGNRGWCASSANIANGRCGCGTGRIIAQGTTVASFPAAAASTNQFALLTATDGANRPGLYWSNGTVWASAIEIAPSDYADAAATMAARPSAAAKADGFRVTTASNGLTWVVAGGAYVVEDMEIQVATIAARDALTEVQTNQRVYVNADDTTYRWNGSAWVTKATAATDNADQVADLSARAAVATRADGYRVTVTTNGLTYEVVDGAYRVADMSISVANAAARTARTELVTGQRITENDTGLTYRWDGSAWVSTATTTTANVASKGSHATLAAANAAQTWPVPAGQAWIATTTTGQMLVANAGDTAFASFGSAASTPDGADVVANMAARAAVAGKADGYRVTTSTNGLTWVVVDGAYQIEDLETTVASIASRDALTEQQTGQRVYCSADNTVYRWDGSAWVTKATAAVDSADQVANLAARAAVATKADGYRVRVTSNGLTYEVIDGAYQVVSMFGTATNAAARTGLSELVTGQRVTQLDTNVVWRWDGAAWVDTAPAALRQRISVVDTSTSAQTVTFDGVADEVRMYRNSGTNALTINAGAGQTFVEGAARLVGTESGDSVWLLLNGTTIEIISSIPR